jgi:CheY-like chemotaxis protein
VTEPPAGYVLVVDDEPDIRDTAALLLEVSGIRAVTASDGREALRVLRTGPPPVVVLLDLRMPVMSGEEFLAERAADPALAVVPVVICSATAAKDYHGGLADVAGYLHKPADPADLLATVRRFLAASHSN